VTVKAGFRNDDTDFPRHARQYRNVRLTVVGCSPAWPNPGGAQSGYLLEGPGRLLLDCGPGVLARLREREPWPVIDAIAVTHWHLDHWGDLVPWVWGQMLGPGMETKRSELWVPPDGPEMLSAIGSRLGRPDMFTDAFDLKEYRENEPFQAAGFEVVPRRVLHYELVAFGFRASANATVLAYSGDSGPSDQLVELARDADLFVCEATLLEPNPEGGVRGHLSGAEAVAAFEASGAKRLLLTHRPFERPLEDSLEQAHDGMELEIARAAEPTYDWREPEP
jgi:ribonuclease BN (tRNA processing enzyme)